METPWDSHMNGESYSSAKTVRNRVLLCLPRRLQHLIKKAYYPGWIKRYREDLWEGSQAARTLIRPGDHVVDVGANLGYVTYMLSKWVGPQGIVHSIEPVPDTFDLLSHTMRRLHVENVRLHPCAAGKEDGRAAMGIPKAEQGGPDYYRSRFVQAHEDTAYPETVMVDVRALDTLCGDIRGRMSFIKIDVEGWENEVVEGAGQVVGPSHVHPLGFDTGVPDHVDAAQLVQTMPLGVEVDEAVEAPGRRPHPLRIEALLGTTEQLPAKTKQSHDVSDLVPVVSTRPCCRRRDAGDSSYFRGPCRSEAFHDRG